MKLVLGTAQFGLNYGINNRRGKLSSQEVSAVLKEAARCGIDTLDTAFAYGDSEKSVGQFLEKERAGFEVISKFPSQPREKFQEIFRKSLHNLKADRLFGYLIHQFESIENEPALWEEVLTLKRRKLIDKTGFSLNFTREAEYLLDRRFEFDIVQVPWNIFDQRFSPYLPEFRKRNIEVYSRSVFLQGLVFRSPDELDGNFRKIKDKLSALKALSKDSGMSVAALCLNFVLRNQNIDKTIIGVDGADHLKENLAAIKGGSWDPIIEKELLKLQENDEDVISPLRWNVKQPSGSNQFA